MTEESTTPTTESEGTSENPESTGTEASEGTFTQADLTRIAAEEKRQGRTAGETATIQELLAATGAEDKDSLVQGYKEYLEIQESVQDEATRAQTAAEKHKARAEKAESELQTLMRESALRDALRDAKLKPDRMALAFRIADMDSLEIGEDRTVTGTEAVVAQLREQSPEWFGRDRTVAEDTSPTTPAKVDFSNMSSEEFAEYSRRAVLGENIIP